MLASGVSRTRRPWRVSSGAPTDRDSAAICCETADGDRCRAAAVAVIVPRSRSSRRVRSCTRSIVKRFCMDYSTIFSWTVNAVCQHHSRRKQRTRRPAMTIAIVGDHNPDSVTHAATDSAFARAGAPVRWIPTPQVHADPAVLAGYDGVLMPPGSPYLSMAGALDAIRYARENDLPLLGTCGGF